MSQSGKNQKTQKLKNSATRGSKTREMGAPIQRQKNPRTSAPMNRILKEAPATPSENAAMLNHTECSTSRKRHHQKSNSLIS